jgi:hypothetical protein
MASGTLGQSSPAAATNTTVYTVPALTVSTVTVSFANRDITSACVRLAVAATGTPSNAEYILYDVLIGQFGTLEKSGIVMSAAKNLVVYSSSPNISVNVYGFEGS